MRKPIVDARIVLVIGARGESEAASCRSSVPVAMPVVGIEVRVLYDAPISNRRLGCATKPKLAL